jgi:ribosomal protein S18 acetylase RimI-like enzyme
MSETRAAAMTDLRSVAAVLADAFHDDPVFAWVFPDLETRPRLSEAMWGFLAEHVYLPVGQSVIADDAAALWQPAGVTVDDEFWVQHGEAFADSIDGQMERLGALAAAMDEHHPVDDCWYLLAIGVRPSAQGRGLGGRMLTHTLEQIDTANEPAYLEATSSRSRALYELHGFEVTGEFAVDDSPPLWPMWRPPARRGA